MFFKPWDLSSIPHNLEKHIIYLRKCIIIVTCSKMDAAYRSIIDFSLCAFFPANCCYPFLSKFRLFLLRWNSIEFWSSVRVTKFTASIWHVLILNVKIKFAENWNWLTSMFFAKALTVAFIFLPTTYLRMRTVTAESKQTKRVYTDTSS